MASTILKLFLTLFALCLLIEPSVGAGGLGVYWGQHTDEGTLAEACDTGYYSYVNIAGLDAFGNDSKPDFNIAGHRENLSQEIQHCQELGVKVILSIGGGGVYTLVSEEDAKNLSEYIWNNFLGGNSDARPVGDAVFDGIDFNIHAGSNVHYDALARYLSNYSTSDQKVYLSAAPQCTLPDYYLDHALKTGLFDYVWIQFYDDPECEYVSGDTTKFLNSWYRWTSYIKAGKLFLGLPAAPEVAPSGGYIPPEKLACEILPTVKTSPLFGGITLWTRYEDAETGYSVKIKASLPTEKDVM